MNASLLRSLGGRCMLLFSAYDNDPREVWQIPEARRYMEKLDAEIPHLLYFLVPRIEAGQFVLWLSCMLPYAMVENPSNFDPSLAQSLVGAQRKSIVEFCGRIRDDPQQAIKRIIEGVPEYLRWMWDPST
jgi:hypothetical protein